ncbi:MAG: serine/threonine-protein phosphatase [Bacteroidales bacterium]|nr:serine/threonine-protein phosphatase [Bacteroidales bacterium]
MKKYYIIILLLLLSTKLLAQNIYIDCLNVDNNISELFYKIQNDPLADYIYKGDSIIKLSKINNNIDQEIVGLFIKGVIYSENTDSLIFSVVDNLSDLCLKYNYQDLYFSALCLKCEYYINNYDIPSCYLQIKKISNLASSYQSKLGMLLSYYYMGELFIFRNNAKNANESYNNALDIAKEIKYKDILDIYLQVVNTYDVISQKDSSNFYMNKAIEYAENQIKDPVQIIKMKILSLTYGDKRQDDEYVKDYDSLANLYNFEDYIKENDLLWIQKAYYDNKGEYEKALEICDKIQFGFETYLAKEEVYVNNELWQEAHNCRMILDEKNDSLQAVIQTADLASFEAEFNNIELKMQADKMRNRNRQIMIATISCIVLLIIGFIVFRIIEDKKRLKKQQIWLQSEIDRQTAEIKQQNAEIISRNEEISVQNEEILSQRNELELANRMMTSSIAYAKRLQNATVPSQQVLKSIFGDFLLMWRPLNIVSGDFYWAKQVEQYKLLVVADCTGHGVPGAFTSMLGIGVLNEIVHFFKQNKLNAAQMLDTARKIVIEVLNQNNEKNETRDGMDMALCIFDTNNNKLEYAGAHRPLVIIRNNKPIIYEGDKMPVGIFHKMFPFSNHTIDIAKGDMIYLYSDGIQDQFGWNGDRENAKFSSKRLIDLLVDINTKPFDEQALIIENAIDNWRKSPTRIIKQIDDQIILGVKI